MKKHILVLIASIMATAAIAQSLTTQEERRVYQKAYAVVNEYAQAASVYDDNKEDHFKSLFANTSMKIYNDLMSLSEAPTLTVDDYVKTLRSAKTVTVTVKNIRKGQIKDEGDYWSLPIMMEKSISYVNSCGTFFDSQEYFKNNYKLIATLNIDKYSGRCYISALKADGEPVKFPKNYKVLVKNDKRDDKLTINGSILSFNPYDQVLLHPGDKIKYLGSDVEEEKVKGECDNKVYAKYNDRSFRVRPNMAFALTDFNKLSKASNDIKTSKAGEMSFGVDLGYVFPSTGRLQTGVFVGIGLSSNTLTMEMTSNGGTLESNADADNYDEDGDTYTRKYQIGKDSVSSITQEMKASDLAIPVYLDLEYRVAPTVSVYADLGVKFQTSTGKLTGSTSNGYTVWGDYSKTEKYKGLTEVGKKGEVVLNDFGYHQAGDIEIDDTDPTKSMAIDAILGLGLRLNIGKSFAVDAGIQYQTGTKSWKTSNKSNDLAHYTKEGGEKFYSFIRHSEGVSHGALKAAVSLLYKF